MAENLFILGAGASAESGAPLMDNFLDVAEDLLREGAFEKVSDEINKVFKVIKVLDRVYAKSYLNLNNIESLFGCLEMARIVGKLEGYSLAEIEGLRTALITLIVKTLEKKVDYPLVNGRIGPTKSYQKLVELLKDKNLQTSSTITFNYDLALDFSMSSMGVPINYCLNEQQGIKLMKLHGSINWAECIKCGEIIPYTLEFFNRTRWFIDAGADIKSAILPVSEWFVDLVKTHPHDAAFKEIPLIVPPTWNKTEYQGNITKVWHEAAKELALARNIYVFGYSLPESDIFFRYLFALGEYFGSPIKRHLSRGKTTP